MIIVMTWSVVATAISIDESGQSQLPMKYWLYHTIHDHDEGNVVIPTAVYKVTKLVGETSI